MVSEGRMMRPHIHLTGARQTTASGATLVQSGNRGVMPAMSTTHAPQTAATSAARAVTTAVMASTGAMSHTESEPLVRFPSMTARRAGTVSSTASRPARARSPSTRRSSLSPAHRPSGAPASSASERMPGAAVRPAASPAHGQGPAARMTGQSGPRRVPRPRGTIAIATVAVSAAATGGVASLSDRPQRSGGQRTQPTTAGLTETTTGATTAVATLREPSETPGRRSPPT